MVSQSQKSLIIVASVAVLLSIGALMLVVLMRDTGSTATSTEQSTSSSTSSCTEISDADPNCQTATSLPDTTIGSDTTADTSVIDSTTIGNSTTSETIQSTTQEPTIPTRKKSLLVIQKITDGTDWHADARPAADSMFRQFAQELNFDVTFTNDSSVVLNSTAENFDAVVLHNTKNNVFETQEKKAAFEAFIASGVNYLGIHEAAGTHNDGTTETTESEPNLNNFWPYMEELNGSLMDDHPTFPSSGKVRQAATVNVADPTHSTTAHFPSSFQHDTEWYNFNRIPPNATILLTIDENTYNPNGWLNEGGMGAVHPIAWHHNFQGQRAFYTAFGHYAEEYQNEAVRTHMREAVRWVLEIE